MDLPLAADADAETSVDVLGVLLTGGTGERLGGVDKAGLVTGGRSLLERGLAALSVAGSTVVVGPPAGTPHAHGPVRFVREQPPGGGPAAGLLAGVDAGIGSARASGAAPQWVAVLAVDMPWVTPATLVRLLATARAGAVHGRRGGGTDGAVLVDAGGRRQLCAVLRVESLLAVRPDAPTGLGFFRLLGALDLADVPAVGREAVDVDTPDDLAALAPPAPPSAPVGVATPTGVREAGRVNPLDAWLADLTAALGPDASLTAGDGSDATGDALDTKLLLDLTRVVAHDVVRPAAPLTLFVLGLVAGRTGAGPRELAALVAQVEALVAARSEGSAATDDARDEH